MTIWYLDYLNGTDAICGTGSGDSFATRRKRFDNMGPYVVNGDTVRVMKSPDPASLGVTGAWTEGTNIASFIPASSTNATPIVFTKSGHGLVTGDTVMIAGHTTNTNANGIWEVSVSGSNFTLLNADGTNSVGNGVGGATGTVQKINHCRVILGSTLTANVAINGNQGAKANWTAATGNITPSIQQIDFKEGGECLSISVLSAFTTGLAAYYPLGSTVNYSSYKQVNFWIKQTAGTLGAAGAITLALCSDTAGATPVNTISIPAIYALNHWAPITIDTGSALGSSIQSIAFNVATNNGAQTFLLDNITVSGDSTTDSSLNLQSLIGKNVAGDTFYGIQSINSVRVMLDQDTNCVPQPSTMQMGYYGVTETVATYRRETLKTVYNASGHLMPSKGGSETAFVTYSGGWDTTNMSTQTGETWFDGLNGSAPAFYGAYSYAYFNFNALALTRYNGAFVGMGTGYNVYNIAAINNNSSSPFGGYVTACVYNIKALCNNKGTGGVIGIQNGGAGVCGIINGNKDFGVYVYGDAVNITADSISGNLKGVSLVSGFDAWFNVGKMKANTQVAIYNTGYSNAVFNNTTFSNNALTYSANSAPGSGKNFLNNCTLSDSTIMGGSYGGAGARGEGGLYSTNEGGVAGYCVNRLNNGYIWTDASIRHTASGYSWLLQPLASATFINSYFPFRLAVARVACGSGSLVTASVWMYRTSTALTARLYCRGGQIAGVSSDVSTNMTAAINTWEQVTITFTPTAVGVVELFAECWGSTSANLYVDDFSASQA